MVTTIRVYQSPVSFSTHKKNFAWSFSLLLHMVVVSTNYDIETFYKQHKLLRIEYNTPKALQHVYNCQVAPVRASSITEEVFIDVFSHLSWRRHHSWRMHSWWVSVALPSQITCYNVGRTCSLSNTSFIIPAHVSFFEDKNNNSFLHPSFSLFFLMALFSSTSFLLNNFN